MARIEQITKEINGVETEIYPVAIHQSVVDESNNETLDVTLGKKAEHGYSEGETPKTLKQVDDDKAAHGYIGAETVKTLKEVETLKASHGYESNPKTLKAVDDAKVDKSSIVGETGQGETTVMHQKAVTDELSAKADLVGGKVPSGQLPSYVDDVVEVATSASLPATGEQGKIYITTDTDAQYRWTGTAYRNISNPVDFATQEEAEGNSENTKAMTSLRVFQSFVKNCASYVFSALNTTSKTLVGAINDLHSGLATKASHGYESNPKTLKEVDDNLAQLAGDVEGTIEMPIAHALSQLKEEVDSLRMLIEEGRINRMQIETLDVISEILINGSPLIYVRDSAPSFSPDQLPQFYIDTAAWRLYTAKGTGSANDWF